MNSLSMIYLRAISQCKPFCHQLQERVPLSCTEIAQDMEIHKKIKRALKELQW